MTSPPDIQQVLGEEVRERRKALGLSQESLAAAADLHVNYLSLIERGINNPTLTKIHSLATALGIKASDLLRATERRLERSI